MNDDQILIVEDDAIAQLTLAQYLKDLGFPHSLAVNNGRDAVKAVEHRDIAMAFLDIRIMGDWDGIDTAHRIREQEPELPLVFLTANTDRGTMKRAQQVHPHAVVQKPYDRKILLRVMGEALSHREDKLVPVVESNTLPASASLTMKSGLSVTDPRGKIISVNPEFCRIHACTESEAVGAFFTRYLPEDIRSFAQAIHREFVEKRTNEGGGRWTILDQLGTSKEVDVEVQRVPVEDGTFYKISMYTDVAQQQQEDENLRKIIAEKDAFAREIHHRVKNNLNVILGLFYLQSEQIKDQPDVYGLFQESMSRIKTMSIIHEQLYNHEEYATIDLGKYITLLSGTIRTTYVSTVAEVSLEVEVDTINIDVDKAVACGLIINELLSNSFKYAFGETVRPQIEIKGAQRMGVVNLELQDNGVGLPPDFDLDQASTLGIRLIKTLTQQLGGQISVENAAPRGTRAKLSFSA